MAVDQFKTAVLKLAGKPSPGKADFGKDRLQGFPLLWGVIPPIPRAGPQVAGTDAAEFLDTVSKVAIFSLWQRC